ncbi:predicted protein [Postia placenta Mad-698-R]|nr:predicted protein [Postia placenta Mad-698-R]
MSTWQATRNNRGLTALNSRGSLTSMLFRDGTVHFALVVGLNATNITSTLLTDVGAFDTAFYPDLAASVQNSLDFSGPVEYISTVVLCRFFLKLRQFSGTPDVNGSTLSSHKTSFSRFASRIIGNLGEMLEDDHQALEVNLDRELDELSDAEEFDSEGDLYGIPNNPSDTNVGRARLSTMVDEVLPKRYTHDRSTPGHDLSVTSSEDQGMVVIV